MLRRIQADDARRPHVHRREFAVLLRGEHAWRGRNHLDAGARTKDVPVGTVDRFQGREAAVVFFTMTTSSAEDMTRGADFLFSRNRLNVAVSRARCLAYLVCTEALLNSRARTVEEMRLISTLCAFVEYADG